MFVCPECGSAQPVGGRCSNDGTVLAPIGDDVLLGTTIGAYRIARLLGIGGMGRVYKGAHPTIGSRVAIKVLSRECSDRRDLVERFFSEAKAVNLIRHESIVNVLDLSMLPDGRPYIIMEYLDGAPLSAIIEHATRNRMPLPLGGLARLAAEVLDALGAAHGKGIVHRDLKPDNIFIAPSGRPKVLDFGIAKLNDQSLSSATRTGSLLGTPHYMSPEQAAGRPVDHRADIYAMGVILFECATGTKPFVAESLFDLLRKHVEAPAPSPRQFRHDLNHEFEQVILMALEKPPERRFGSAQAMSVALQSATANLPVEQWTPITGSGTHRAQPSGGWQPTPPQSWGGHSRVAPRESVQPPMQHPQPLHPPIGHLSTVSASSGQVQLQQLTAKPPSRKALWIGLGALALAGGGIAVGVAASSGSGSKSSTETETASEQREQKPVAIDTTNLERLRGLQVESAKLVELEEKMKDLGDISKRLEGTPTPARPAGGGTAPPAMPNTPPGFTPPPPPPPRSGPWLQTRDLGFPMSYDPAKLDVAAFIKWSMTEAKRVVPDAELFRIDVDNVAPDGTANLNLPTMASSHGSLDLRFRSPSQMTRDPSVPKGVKQNAKCEFRIEAEPDGAQIRAVEGFPCDKEVPIAPPKCSPVQLWKRAIAKRAPSDAVANLGYRFASGAPKWYFDIGTPGDMLFGAVFDDGC